MADLSITAASVVPGTDSVQVVGVSGDTITAGQCVYLDSTTNTYKRSDNDSGTAGARTVTGIALTGSSANQPVVVHRRGTYTVGATVVAGLAYYLSATPGSICVIGDVTAGHDPVLVGMATSTTVMNVNPQDPAVTN